MMDRKTQQKRKNGTVRHTEKRRKKGWDPLSLVILMAAICVFVFSGYKLILTLVPYYSGGEEYDQVKSRAIIQDITGKDADGDTKEAAEFQVDFDVLMQENPDTVGWIRFDQPDVISYPVVQGKDNEEYLTKTFTANDNKLGAIFMDVNCQSDFSSRNTIIYGHHLNVGGEMFSLLEEYKEESFCKEHPYFYIYTPDGKTRTYQVFAAGVIKDTAVNYQLVFNSDEEFRQYIENCRASSAYQTDVQVNEDAQIISLSTCTNVRDDERFIVQGVLIGVEE